jgi:microcystin-dependent protein
MKKIQMFQGGHPFHNDDLLHMQEGLIEAIKAVVEAIASVGDTPNANAYILKGVVETGNVTSYTSGYIYYNGEVFEVIDGTPLLSIGNQGEYYWEVEQSTVTPSPVTYQDGQLRNVHIRRRMRLVLANSVSEGVLRSQTIRLSKTIGIVPKSGIIMYSGAVSNFSSGVGITGSTVQGWALCDGSNGTPDLRGRFIVGYNPSSNTAPADTTGTLGINYGAIGNRGGSNTVELTPTQTPLRSHTHTATSTLSGSISSSGNHSHSVGTDLSGNQTGSTHRLLVGTNNSTHTTLQNPDSSIAQVGDQGSNVGKDGAHTHTHTFSVSTTVGNPNVAQANGDSHENRPPYYVLAFIMKL